MGSVNAVYIMTDLEGAAGIDDWDPRHQDYGNQAKGVFERSEMQRLLTGEVNAAAEGLFEAGVSEVLVNDAHGAGRTILPEELISGVKIARGRERPSWLIGITGRYDALVQVGMHAMWKTPNGCLAHSMSPGKTYRLNGREFGEMEMAGHLAGQLGIPWVFTSGDAHACTESEAWVPGIVTAPVKEGLSTLSAIHLAPTDARDMIRARVQDAVAQAGEIAPLVVEGGVTIELERDEPWPAKIPPGCERTDPFTVRYTGTSFWQVFHLMTYGVADLPLPEGKVQ